MSSWAKRVTKLIQRCQSTISSSSPRAAAPAAAAASSARRASILVDDERGPRHTAAYTGLAKQPDEVQDDMLLIAHYKFS